LDEEIARFPFLHKDVGFTFFFPEDFNESIKTNLLNNIKSEFSICSHISHFENKNLVGSDEEQLKALNSKFINETLVKEESEEDDKINCKLTVNVYSDLKVFNTEINEKNNQTHYGFMFKTPTEYTLRFSQPTDLFAMHYYNKLLNSKSNTHEHYYKLSKSVEYSGVQYMINKAIKSTMAPNTLNYKIMYKPVDQEYKSIEVRNNAEIFSRVILCNLFFFSWNICIFLSFLISERESGFVEYLKKNGINTSLLWASWAFIYSAIIFSSSFYGSYCMHFFKFFTVSAGDLKSVFAHTLILFLYGIGCCSLAIFFAVSIKNPKRLTVVRNVMFVAPLLVYFAFKQYDKDHQNYQFLFEKGAFFLFPISFVKFLIQELTFDVQKEPVSIQKFITFSELRLPFITYVISIAVTVGFTIFYILKDDNKKTGRNNVQPSSENVEGGEQQEDHSIQSLIKNFKPDKEAYSTVMLDNSVDFTHSSSLKQIFTVFIIRFNSFLENQNIFIFYICAPLCVFMAYFFLLEFIKDGGEYAKTKPIDISPTIYNNTVWFKDNSLDGDILRGIEKNVSLESFNYNKEVALNPNIFSLQSEKQFVGGFGGKWNEEKQEQEIHIYYNPEYQFSLPIAINLLDNAILQRHSQQYGPLEIKVTYRPCSTIWMTLKKIIDIDDEDEWVNSMYLEFNHAFNIKYVCGISEILSFVISCFGPLVIKDKKRKINSELFAHGIKRRNYWIGILLSDTLYMMIPSMISIGVSHTLFPSVDVFSDKLIGLTIVINILCTIHCLLYQYVICFQLKNYRRTIVLFTLLIPYIVSKTELFRNSNILSAEPNSESFKYTVVQNLLYSIELKFIHKCLILAFAPCNFKFYLYHFSYLIIKNQAAYTPDDFHAFLKRKAIPEVVAKQMTFSEKEALSKEYLMEKVPSVSEVLFGWNQYSSIILFIVAGILLSISILYYFESNEERKRKKDNKRD